MKEGESERRQFDVVSDGGLDSLDELENEVPVAPFSFQFGKDGFTASEISREDFFARLRGDGPHPTTAQPAPNEFAKLFAQSERPVLAVTISSSLSGSFSSANQAVMTSPTANVTLHDSGTLSGAQAFQVHAAMVARERGHSIDTALKWMRQVHEETELYFTIDTLDYLRKGGRIGMVQATLGGLLSLRPVVTVDKSTGTYTSVGRGRKWTKALDAVAKKVADRYGEGRPLRAAVLYGEDPADANDLLERLSERHRIVWHSSAPVGLALAVHTGPKAVGLAVAPGGWPWEDA